MARKRRNKEERDYSSNRGGVGYSQAALDALKRGEYGKLTGRQAQYNTSQEQTQQAKSLPVLKGVSIPTNTTENFESSFSRKNYVDTDNARRKYEQRIGHTPTSNIQADSFKQYDNDMKKAEFIARTNGQAMPEMQELIKNIPSYSMMPEKERKEFYKQSKSEKPSSKYQNNVIAKSVSEPKKSTRDKSFDNDFDEFYDYRAGDYLNVVDYDPAQDADVEHWRNLKKDIMKKHNWTEQEFDKRWNEYYDERNQEAADTEVKMNLQLAKDHPVLGTIGQFAYTPQTWVEGAMTGVQGASAKLGQLTGKNPLKDYTPTSSSAPQFTGTRVKEGVKQEVRDNHIDSGLGKLLYEAGTGVGDMALSLALPGGALGTALQKASNKQMQALERGIDSENAARTAALQGINGYILGKVGLDKVLGATGKTPIRGLAKAGFTEGAENVVEDWIDYAIDTWVNGDKSELNTLHDYYVSQGGDENAWMKVIGDKADEALTSFVSGAVAGSAFNAVKNLPELKSYISSKSNNSLGAVDKSFSDLFGEEFKNNTINIDGSDYSVDRANQNLIDANGNEIPVIDPSVFDTSKRGTDEQTKREFAAQLTKYIKDNFLDKTFVIKDNGHEVGFIDRSAKEFAGSRSSMRKNNNSMGLKANIAPRLQSVIENAIFNHHEANVKTDVPIKARGLDKYDISIAYPTEDGIKLYDAVMDIGLHQDGNEYFFDILNIEPKKKSDPRLLSDDSVTNLGRPSFDNNVNQNSENVNRTEGANDSGNPTELDPTEQARQLEMARIRTELDLNAQMQEAIRTGRDADGRMVTGVTDADAELRRLSAERESLERQLSELSTFDERADADLDALTNFVNSQRNADGQQNNVPPQNPPQPPNNGNGGGNVPPTNPPSDNGGGNVPPSNNGGGNVPPNTPINLTQDANGNVVESGTSQHLRSTVDVRVATPMKYDIPDEVAMEFVNDPQMYKQLKNADTQALADAIYESGDTPVTINGKAYQGNAEAKFRQLLSEKNPASLPLGKKIADDYSAQGNHDMAAQVYRDMGSALTEAGQFTQASIISMMKSDPLTALAYLEKEIAELNADGQSKYGKKWKDFELTDAEKKLFDDIEVGDTDAIRNAYDEIGARLEKEYPATAWEKVLEFRRVAMLLNTRTIVRNTAANPPTALLRYISDRIEGVGQYVAHLINPDFEITQSIRGSNSKLRKQAVQVFNSDKVQNMLKETPGRLSEVPKIGDYAKSKQMFKGGIVSDFINKLTDNGIEKLNAKLGKKGAKSALELARNAAYSALEVTDNPFVRENFISRLGSYMRAKGITSANDVPDEAINIALEEALKATYKDNSWLVQGIRNAKGAIENIGNGIMPGVRLGDMASQALIPYVQAPGNIGARIIDYSPIGATKGITDIINGASKSNNKLLAKGIEEFSKGATGSMMAALGMALYRSGILTGTYSTDKDQKAFEKQNGFREFAIKWTSPIDGKVKYDTIDWAQPFVDTLMPGVLLAQAIENSDGYDSDILRYFGIEGSPLGKGIGIAADTIGKNVNYFFNATPLKNLGELLSSKANGDTDIAGNLWQNTVEDFASALVPASVNALAKSVDPIQRQTYNPDNSFGTFLNTNAAKVPELSKTLPAKYDTWGQPLTYGDSKGEAALAKMLYPGEHTSDRGDAIDAEINRLFDETQNKGVFPQVSPYSVDGVKLTDKEVSEYQRTMGQRNRKMAETFVNSDSYQKLDDNARAEVLEDMFNASKAIADNEIKGKEFNNTYKSVGEIYKTNGEEGVVNYYLSKHMISDAGISSSSKAAKEAKQAMQSGDVEGAQKILDEAAIKKQEKDAKKATTTSATTATTTSSIPSYEGTEHYDKVIARAGAQSAKLKTDFPALKGMGLPESADYVYANAINKNPSMTVPEFTQTYKEMDTNPGDKLTQKEVLAYINAYQLSDDPDEDMKLANELWNTYQDGTWKKSLYLKKDGTYGAK